MFGCLLGAWWASFGLAKGVVGLYVCLFGGLYQGLLAGTMAVGGIWGGILTKLGSCNCHYAV